MAQFGMIVVWNSRNTGSLDRRRKTIRLHGSWFYRHNFPRTQRWSSSADSFTARSAGFLFIFNRPKLWAHDILLLDDLFLLILSHLRKWFWISTHRIIATINLNLFKSLLARILGIRVRISSLALAHLFWWTSRRIAIFLQTRAVHCYVILQLLSLCVHLDSDHFFLDPLFVLAPVRATIIVLIRLRVLFFIELFTFLFFAIWNFTLEDAILALFDILAEDVFLFGTSWLLLNFNLSLLLNTLLFFFQVICERHPFLEV